MKRLAALALVLACVAAGVLGLYISAANREPLLLDLLFWPEVSLRSGIALVLAFVVGGLCGLATGLFARGAGKH